MTLMLFHRDLCIHCLIQSSMNAFPDMWRSRSWHFLTVDVALNHACTPTWLSARQYLFISLSLFQCVSFVFSVHRCDTYFDFRMQGILWIMMYVREVLFILFYFSEENNRSFCRVDQLSSVVPCIMLSFPWCIPCWHSVWGSILLLLLPLSRLL
jgi:hypothetical protein